MTLAEFTELIAQQKSPTSLSTALQALWYAKRGNWPQAHELVQNASDRDSAWVHAYLHREEGDLSNARYWYRQSRQPEFTDSLSQEWKHIASSLLRDRT
ncbi:MAG: hypothetical protein ACFB4I_05760 [Cyanophyceae cyanobacterium]